jgi:hypothetical protein
MFDKIMLMSALYSKINTILTKSANNNLITIVIRLTRRVSLVGQELLTLPEHPAFSGVRVTRSSVLCVCIVDRCLSFCTFSFGHCVLLLRYKDSDYLPLVSSNFFYYVYHLTFLCIIHTQCRIYIKRNPKLIHL